MTKNLPRRDSIVRLLRFIKLFYKLEPRKNVWTIRQIAREMECSLCNARHWIVAAGDEIPIYEPGKDLYHHRKGPAGTTYGVLR